MTRKRSWPRPPSWTIPTGMFPSRMTGCQCSGSSTAKSHAQNVFKAVPELHFIFLTVPSYMSLGSTLITVFHQVGTIPNLTSDEDFAVQICLRHNHYPQLHVRKARVEDHDDLMPIFMHYDTVLKETYGEYFLAELIEAQDEENHAVVCEVSDSSVWAILSERNKRHELCFLDLKRTLRTDV
uniref:Cilia- and flagella-associated protein 61 N-terminal domain-containing protein n=1 Tax=Spermophilus dauricus TaxID=99837 RepID=A0A8C9P9R3_SPEDA